jgi:hypothetical protein
MRKITDKKELTKLVSFIIMGDGGVYIRKNMKNAHFIMNMIQDNEDFVDYCMGIISNVTSIKKYNINKKSPRKPQFSIVSKSHPFFTKLRNRIYQGAYKGLDWHAMKMLDWEAMAILYMSDGNFHRYLRPEIGMKNESYTVTLNMKRLSYGDTVLLKKYIKDKLGVEFNVQKQKKRNNNGYYYYLRLRGKHVKEFMTKIKSYILESFKYKILDEELSSEEEMMK